MKKPGVGRPRRRLQKRSRTGARSGREERGRVDGPMQRRRGRHRGAFDRPRTRALEHKRGRPRGQEEGKKGVSGHETLCSCERRAKKQTLLSARTWTRTFRRPHPGAAKHFFSRLRPPFQEIVAAACSLAPSSHRKCPVFSSASRDRAPQTPRRPRRPRLSPLRVARKRCRLTNFPSTPAARDAWSNSPTAGSFSAGSSRARTSGCATGASSIL